MANRFLSKSDHICQSAYHWSGSSHCLLVVSIGRAINLLSFWYACVPMLQPHFVTMRHNGNNYVYLFTHLSRASRMTGDQLRYKTKKNGISGILINRWSLETIITTKEWNTRVTAPRHFIVGLPFNTGYIPRSIITVGNTIRWKINGHVFDLLITYNGCLNSSIASLRAEKQEISFSAT